MRRDNNPNDKYLITIREAAKMFGVGENKIRNMISLQPDLPFLLRNGNRIYIKSKFFEEYLDAVSSI